MKAQKPQGLTLSTALKKITIVIELPENTIKEIIEKMKASKYFEFIHWWENER